MRRTAVAACVFAALAAVVWLLARARDDGSTASPDRTPAPGVAAPAAATVDAAAPTLAVSPPTLPPAPSAREDGAPAPVAAADDGIPLRLEVVDAWDGHRIDRGEDHAVLPHLVPGVSQSATLGTAAPEGYVVLEPLTWNGRLARHARSALWIHPFHREALVRVHLSGPWGKPARDARVARFRVDGRVGTPRFEEHDPTRARGIPFLPGEVLELEAGWDPPALPAGESVEQEVVEEGGGFTSTERLVLPESPNAEVEVWIDLPPRPAGTLALVDHVETDNDLPYEESLGEGGGTDDFGSLRVLVRARDGGPVASALVHVVGVATGQSDARGVASFERVPVGARTVHLVEPGRTWTEVDADVSKGKTSEVVLREPAGATLVVDVVDETGARVRFPRVTVVVRGAAHADVDDEGVQRLDPFADVHGRRTFRHVAAGAVIVRAEAGRRRGEATAEVREGGEHRVRVEVSPR